MLLTFQDAELFFKLHRALMFFVNQRLKVLSNIVASPDEFSALSPEVRLKVRNAFLGHTDLIQQLARKRPSPLLHGKPETWASGIVRTIGWINFPGKFRRSLSTRG